MKQPLDLWNDFCSGFIKALEKTPEDDFLKAWTKHPERTVLYRSILKTVAEHMELTCKGELFKVDFAFWTKESDPAAETVPIVFLETENNVYTCHQEVRKLSSITAPLKVLIAVTEWDETPGVWPKGSYRKKRLNEWQHIVRSYNARWPRSGMLGIIIGEARPDRMLYFHGCLITDSGDLMELPNEPGDDKTNTVLFRKKLDWTRIPVDYQRAVIAE